MRQLLVAGLSLGSLILLAAAPASPAESFADRGVELARKELARTVDLVSAGALPRIRIQQAEANLADAMDEVTLAHALYGDLPDNGASVEASAGMIAAAQRRVDRQQARLDEARKLVEAGVTAQSSVPPIEAELISRQASLDLANLRANLMVERAAEKVAIDKLAASAIEPPPAEIDLFLQDMEHYEGAGLFEESRDLQPLELAFLTKFARPLPISAEGETDLHRALGFDHRGRVDVAVVPSEPEGVWLRQYLKLRRIPYYAFARAIPGKATAAHIHIGPGSTRTGARPHSAD